MLTGCPGAILLSAMVHDEPKGYVHPPNDADYASWLGEPQISIESHPQFSLLPREVRQLSDGSELWFLRYCPKKGPVSVSNCCMYEFVVRSRAVASYRTAGVCGVNCGMRPESKVQACINAALVPDGYR
jgi:hypothetical protein